MPRALERWRRLLPRDPVPRLLDAGNEAIAFFAARDLLGEERLDLSLLWETKAARAILARQTADGSWRYPGGGKPHRTGEDYDQLETFRQTGVLVEKHGLTREHPALARAAEFLFSRQTAEGDFRGIYGAQYATTYVGAIMEVLIKAGYGEDPRIAAGFRWLLSMRQDDGGWAIPLRTVGVPFSEFVGAERHPEPLSPDRSKPSAHLITGIALRAFAAHPVWRASAEAKRASELLASRLYKKDAYSDRGDPAYWDRVSFPFWFTDVVSALDTLSRLSLSPDAPPIRAALDHVRALQRADDGCFAFKLLKDKDPDLPLWICLAVCRVLRRWYDA